MVKRVYIAAVNLIFMSVLFFSCEKESMGGLGENSDVIKIVGNKSESVSRSVPPNDYFNQGVRYRLWAYDNNNDNYIFKNSDTSSGIVAKESEGHFIEIDDANRSLLVDSFTIYGLTDNKTKNNDNAFPTNPNNPTKYTLSRTGSVDPSGINYVNQQLIDYYRGKFEYVRAQMPIDSKGLIVMNFKHIMSQLKISILQQPDKKTGYIYKDLKVTKIELEGDYSSMVYDVKTDAFSNSVEYSNGSLRTLWEWDDAITVANNKITKAVKYFVTSTVFPTLSAGREYNLYLTLDGDDAQKFNLENGKVKIELTDSGLGETNLNFKQNYSYHIQVFFMSGNVHVIAIRPEVYPWLDGETDNGEQGDMYEEVALGNTLLFDNLLWADRNLGATEFSPMVSFEKCTGFYYQFQRNIPYFPKTLANNQSVYPVTSNSTANDQGPQYNKNFIQTIDNLDNVNNSNYAGFGLGNNIIGNQIWSESVSNQPVPPGWRIPSSDDFLSTMPSCAAAGNITFLSWTKEESDKTGHGHANLLDGHNVISVKVPYDSSYDYYPKYNSYRYWHDRKDWEYAKDYVPDVIPDIMGDPSAGYSSVYVISKSDTELDNVDKPIKRIMYEGGHSDPDWGTIYAIKKIGTDEAYRMRWHIVRPIAGYDNYVLVVSKYSASKDDKLLFRDKDINSKYYYRNYDWDNPSAVMYIPIVGMIGTNSSWQEGKVGNFGTETIFLTTDEDESNKFKTFRIKIAGNNAANMFIFVSRDFGGNGGQLRLVRDITN